MNEPGRVVGLLNRAHEVQNYASVDQSLAKLKTGQIRLQMSGLFFSFPLDPLHVLLQFGNAFLNLLPLFLGILELLVEEVEFVSHFPLIFLIEFPRKEYVVALIIPVVSELLDLFGIQVLLSI